MSDHSLLSSLSLRTRAVAISGASLLLLWALAATWMVRGVNLRFSETLDGRLQMSAQMVASLFEQSHSPLTSGQPDFSQALQDAGLNGIACEIRAWHHRDVPALSIASASPDAYPSGFSTRHVDGEEWRVYVLRTGGYQITTADRMQQRAALSNEVLTAAAVPFLIAMLGGLGMLWVSIRRGLAPLDTLSKELAARSAASMAPVALGACPRELEPVLTSMNELLRRLSGAIASQRSFTDAAAHELRTPLTIIDTHLQVALATTGGDRERSLRYAGQGVAHLSRTLQQLLDLARSEADQSHSRPTTSVVDVIMQVWEQLDETEKQRLIIDYPLTDAATCIPPELLGTAIRNLVDNALKYSRGPVHVSMPSQIGNADDVGSLCIGDRGPGLNASQLAVVGRRFWRGDQELRGTAGAGLGISIVRAVMGAFGGDLHLYARPGGGLLAELRLPPRA